MTPGIIERYAAWLPVTPATPLVSLGEGSRPLVTSRRIGPSLGLSRLFFKYEGLNPSGSFKDRGMALAVAKAIESGAHALICASTGNTSASASAYAASRGLKALVVLPSGGVATGKLAQALAYGALIVPVRGNFDRALEVVRALAQTPGYAVVNSINPFRIEGQKTAALEDRAGRPRPVARIDRGRHRRGDPFSPAAACPRRGPACRAGLRRRCRAPYPDGAGGRAPTG